MSVVKKTQTGKKFLEKINTGADTGIVAISGKFVDGTIPADAVYTGGNVGIDVQPTEKLSVQGVIESKTGGIKFPDATIQTTAASPPTSEVNVNITKKIKSNGEIITTQELVTPFTSPTLLASTPNNSVKLLEISPNGAYLATGGRSSIYFIKIYKIEGDSLTLLTNVPASMNSSISCNDLVWSKDSSYLIGVSRTNSPKLFFYKRIGDSFVERTDIPLPPSFAPTSVDWSIDNILSVASDSLTTGVYQYQVTGDNFVQLATELTTSSLEPEEIKWSNNGEFMATALSRPFINNPILRIYQKSGVSTLTQIFSDVNALPVLKGISLAWSPDDRFLVIGVKGSSSTQRLFLYERSGVSFTDITSNMDVFPNSANFPGAQVTDGVMFSPDGKTFAFSLESTTDPAKITTYSVNGNTFTKDANLPSTPIGLAYGISFSLDGKKLFMAHQDGIETYKTISNLSLPAHQNIVKFSEIEVADTFKQIYNKRVSSPTDIITSGQGIYAITDTSIQRTVTLSSADAVFEGIFIVIKDESGGASTNNIIIDTEGSETIDGLATKTITTGYQSLVMYSDGNNWFVV